jgi:hypothetical protein
MDRWWDDADRGKPTNWIEEPASVYHDDDDDDNDEGEEEGDTVNGDANS